MIPKPTTQRPITVPALKATLRAPFKLRLAAWHVLTLALTAMDIPTIPVAAEVMAPARKHTGVPPVLSATQRRPKTIRTNIARIWYSLHKKAWAPILMLSEISYILAPWGSATPMGDLRTLRARKVITKRAKKPAARATKIAGRGT